MTTIRTHPRLLAIVALAALLTSACSGPATSTPSPSHRTSVPQTAMPTCSPRESSVPTSSAGPTAAPTACPASAETPAATPAPTPRATPRPTASPRPTIAPTLKPSPPPSAAPASQLVRHGSRTGSEIALTYDMGGRVGDALAIVDWLVSHRVHASIFMTGGMAESSTTDAGRRVLAIVEAHADLFTLGNHSYTHADFRDLTVAEILDELRRTEAAIGPFYSQSLQPFFRPPNGGYNDDVLAAVGRAGYRYTVTWDVDTIDWRPIANDPPGPTADQIVAKVLANAQGGSIILNHLGGYETYEALPRVVQGLRDKGFDLVTLDELMNT